LETKKLLTKSKLEYFLKILGAEKPIKRDKLQGEREASQGFLSLFFLCNSFVLPPYGRLNLFG